MNKPAGKARIAVIALVAAVFAIVGLYSSSASAQPMLFVTDQYTDAVTSYPAASTGNVAPSATITGLTSPQGIAQDSSGNVYVVDDSPPSVVVYPPGSTGDATPSATIAGSSTGLRLPLGIAVDSAGNIYVTDAGNGSCDGHARVFVYPAGSDGDVAPSATISGAPLCYPMGIALDSSANINVADEHGVLVYPAGSNGAVAPSATIPAFGTNDELTYPMAIALDSSANIYVSAYYMGGVFVYAAGSNGDVAPIANLPGYGVNDGLLWPWGIAVDSAGNIYVADYYVASVFVYAPGSNGDVAPLGTINGSLTGLVSPTYIALQPGVSTPPPATTKVSLDTSLAFGDEPVGNTVTKNLTVKNTGRAPLFVTSVTSNSPLNLAPGTSTCPAGGLGPTLTCTITIEFTPDALGKHRATLTLHDNAGRGAQNVAVSGTGLADVMVSPAAVAYGKVKLSAKKSKTIKVKNAQPTAVALSESITGADAGDFAITGGTCSTTLASKTSCTYVVRFTPGADGARAATLIVTASPDLLSPHDLSLRGTGS